MHQHSGDPYAGPDDFAGGEEESSIPHNRDPFVVFRPVLALPASIGAAFHGYDIYRGDPLGSYTDPGVRRRVREEEGGCFGSSYVK